MKAGIDRDMVARVLQGSLGGGFETWASQINCDLNMGKAYSTVSKWIMHT